MIINKQVNIKIGSVNNKYYKKLGFNNIKNGDIISVSVNKILDGSLIKVDVRCDICDTFNNIYYQKYTLNIKRHGYYSCKKCSVIKRRKTNLEKYGVDNVSKLNDIKEKKKLTTKKNHGVENPSQSKEISIKKKNTMRQNYGVNYSLESNILYNNMKKVKKEKYDFEYYTNHDKQKETILRKYGVDNISKLDSVKKAKRETCYKNYGVEHPSQNKKIFDKQQKSAFKVCKFKNITYQGTYEKDFLDNYYNLFNITKISPISYDYCGKTSYYHPDFYIKELNLIIEIKSDYTYNKEYIKNISKQTACINKGYNFLFIINKDYTEFKKTINKK